MVHLIDPQGNAVVDWKSGDPEGDRKYLFEAYRAFLRELNDLIELQNDYVKKSFLNLFDKWEVKELNIDDFPRISIKYPEGYLDNL